MKHLRRLTCIRAGVGLRGRRHSWWDLIWVLNISVSDVYTMGHRPRREILFAVSGARFGTMAAIKAGRHKRTQLSVLRKRLAEEGPILSALTTLALLDF
jgi:hypothetical protein